jgi:phage FluMu protein gp41
MRDPIILVNQLSERVKAVAQEHGFTPQQMRQMTLRDLSRFYGKHQNLSARKASG